MGGRMQKSICPKLKIWENKYGRTIRIKIPTSESERSKSSIMSACVGDVYAVCKFEKSKKQKEIWVSKLKWFLWREMVIEMNRKRWCYGVAELKGANGDDEDAEHDGDVAVASDLGRGARDAGLCRAYGAGLPRAYGAGLPWAHFIPAPRMQERLLEVLGFVLETHCHLSTQNPERRRIRPWAAVLVCWNV